MLQFLRRALHRRPLTTFSSGAHLNEWRKLRLWRHMSARQDSSRLCLRSGTAPVPIHRHILTLLHPLQQTQTYRPLPHPHLHAILHTHIHVHPLLLILTHRHIRQHPHPLHSHILFLPPLPPCPLTNQHPPHPKLIPFHPPLLPHLLHNLTHFRVLFRKF